MPDEQDHGDTQPIHTADEFQVAIDRRDRTIFVGCTVINVPEAGFFLAGGMMIIPDYSSSQVVHHTANNVV